MGSTTGLVSHRYLCCPLTCHVVHSTLKMRSGFLLLLVVSAILVSQSEAGLWGKAAWLAVKWARKNCHANLSGIGCKWGRKRSEGEAMSEEQEASLQTVCEAIQAHGSGGLSLEYVKDVLRPPMRATIRLQQTTCWTRKSMPPSWNQWRRASCA